MALALGHWKESGHSPCLLGPFAGDSGAPRLSRPSYGSISSSPSPGPQQAPPGGTYLSEKIPIPDTEQVGMMKTPWALSGLTGSCGTSQAGEGRSTEDQGKPFLALSSSDGQ